MEQLHGYYSVLYRLPIWVSIIIIYGLSIFVVGAGREYFEGFSYDVSLSSRYGNIGLMVIFIIGITVLKNKPYFEGWIATQKFQIICGAILVLVCGIMIVLEYVMLSEGVERQLVDIYHNLFILPLFIYLLIILIPLIFINGTNLEQGATLILLAIWLVLFMYDVKDGRLDQRRWIREHGYSCILTVTKK